MTVDKLIRSLNSLDSSEVFFGPQGFKHMTTEDELQKAQLGFGMNELGQAISNTDHGCWQASWLVFARDTELGDPYFVDIQQVELPVYTGFLADEGWELAQVATTLSGYVCCMQLLFDHGGQTQAQFYPDQTSVKDDSVIAQLEQKLIELSGYQHFWQLFIQCYRDWLIEE